jgi:hypothetical protein
VFAPGFYQLLEEVAVPGPEGAALTAKLAHAVADSDARREIERRLATRDADAPQLDDQIELFRHRYPLGFADPAWTRDVRGHGARRHLKRHRDAVLARAASELEAGSLERSLTDKQHKLVIDLLVAILSATDLLTARQVDPLRAIPPEHHEEAARSIVELLHGKEPYSARFTRFARVIAHYGGAKPSWPLVTAPSALVHPGEHIAVRPATFREQARTVAPHLVHAKAVGPSTYAHLLAMAEHVRDKLNEEGLGTRDLMDVHDFMRVTLAPAARDEIVARRTARLVQAA